LARTAQVQSLLAQQLAYFATTQVSTAAVKVDNSARHGRINSKDRRRGLTPAAVLCFGDGR
jgi:hypothetical protein